MAERKRFLLRLDPAVYDAIARWAGDDLRSVNTQIEYALRRALKDAGRPVGRPARLGAPADRGRADGEGEDGEAPEESPDGAVG